MKKGEQRAMTKLIYILNKERVDTEALVQLQTLKADIYLIYTPTAY
jgi:hypothetical protein